MNAALVFSILLAAGGVAGVFSTFGDSEKAGALFAGVLFLMISGLIILNVLLNVRR